MMKEIFLLSLLVFSGCILYHESGSPDDGVQIANLEIQGQVAKSGSSLQAHKNESLKEFQVTACNSAHAHSTCDRLANFTIVTKEQCCKQLSKCCS